MTTQTVSVPDRLETRIPAHCAEPPLGELSDLLGRAALRSSDPLAVVAALARLDPTAAVEWLLVHEGEARAPSAAPRIAPLLDRVAADALAHGQAPLLAKLARVYPDLIPPGTVAAVGAHLPRERRAESLGSVVDAVLERAPAHPGLLRLAAELARDAGEDEAAHGLLTRLGRVEPTPATLQHVLRARRALRRPVGEEVRIALLGSYTLDPIVPFVDLECRALGLVPDLYVAPYGAWEREVVSGDSGLYRSSPEIAFLAVSIDDLVPGLDGCPGIAELERGGEEALQRLLAVAERFTSSSGAVLVVHGFHSAFRDPRGTAGREGSSRTAWLSGLNVRLEEGLRTLPRAHFLDLRDVLLRRAGGAIENPKMRHLGRMRLGECVLGDVARACAGYVAPLKGLTRKCVVVDLDNTLWGGIVGEDGLHGIRLGSTSPGSEFVEFQHCLLALRRRGILLAVISKNNPEDALAVLRTHDAMVLREEHFSALRVNWRPKPENLRDIARELGLGTDSFVFLDDSPNERDLMRRMLPEVLTPELPADPALYRGTVEGLPQLQVLAVTTEDLTRADRYRARQEREQSRLRVESLEEYLHSLQVAVAVAEADEAALSRVHQLFQRTNQFNLTTRRYTLSELDAFARDPGWRLYGLRARDRFGDHGLVAAALVRVAPRTWRVDSLLMSCRTIGYGVETALLATMAREARVAGAEWLEGEYVATEKNGPARDFYREHGFSPAEGGGERWRLSLAERTVHPPTWIRMEKRDAT